MEVFLGVREETALFEAFGQLVIEHSGLGVVRLDFFDNVGQCGRFAFHVQAGGNAGERGLLARIDRPGLRQHFQGFADFTGKQMQIGL